MNINLKDSPVGNSAIILDEPVNLSYCNFDQGQLKLYTHHHTNNEWGDKEVITSNERATFVVRPPENTHFVCLNELMIVSGGVISEHVGCIINDVRPFDSPALLELFKRHGGDEMYSWLDSQHSDETLMLKALVLDFLAGHLELSPEILLLKMPTGATQEYIIYFKPVCDPTFSIALAYSMDKPLIRLAGRKIVHAIYYEAEDEYV